MISVACMALTVSLPAWKFTIGGIHCGFSLLLVCMMSSVFCNICDFSEELLERVDGWMTPLFILFFILGGAELDFGILKNSSVLLLGLTMTKWTWKNPARSVRKERPPREERIQNLKRYRSDRMPKMAAPVFFGGKPGKTNEKGHENFTGFHLYNTDDCVTMMTI